MITDALASRLLTAAFITYFRDAATEAVAATAASTAMDAEVGYLARPAVFIDGTTYQVVPPFGVMLPDITVAKTRDAVTVGVTPSEIIVAFRGTIPFDGAKDKVLAVSDWLNDFDARPTSQPHLPGFVHGGFAEAVDNLWTEITGALGPLLEAHPGLPVCFTGHSKGGAMAHIAAVRFYQEGHAQSILVCTFAAAKAGDPTFAAAFDVAVSDSRRYEYGDDIVPHVPSNGGLSLDPAKLPFGMALGLWSQVAALSQGYRPAGKLYYLNAWPATGAKPPPQRPLLQAEVNPTDRVVAIGKAVTTWDLSLPLNRSWIAVNHDIAPGSGYYCWIHRP